MKKMKLLTSLLLISAMIIGVWGTPMSAKAVSTTSAIHFIDCGGGNATLIESVDSKGNKIYGLIDGGEEKTFNKVKQYLDSQLGTKKLSFIAISHLHIDHAGAIVSIINAYADQNTTLYFKDVSESLNVFDSSGNADAKSFSNRYKAIRSAARAKKMPVTKIMETTKLPSGITNSNISSKVTPAMLKTKLKPYTMTSGNYKFTGSYLNNITLGEFTITFFNGQNWNDQGFIKNKWNENVNSVTTLLRCKTSAGKVYTAYLGSDLGAKTTNSYAQAISLKAIEAFNKEITLYQIPHHGYVDSINNTIAKKLNFKFAVATTSYDAILGKKNFTLAENITTLQRLFASPNFNSGGYLYFTGGSNLGNTSQFNLNIVNKITPSNTSQVTVNNKQAFKNGTVVAEMGSSFAMRQLN